MVYETKINFRLASEIYNISIKKLKQAYLKGHLRGEYIDGELFLISVSLKAWIKAHPVNNAPQQLKGVSKKRKQKDTGSVINTSGSQQRAYLDGSAQPKGDPDKDPMMHQIYDPRLTDHQIPDYYKYKVHDEESYKSFYDDYDDFDGSRYD